MTRSLRIKVNGIFLNFEKADLKITEENNSFTDGFSLKHNSYPLRIIEDENCIRALGDPSISNTKKRKNYQATMYIGSSVYFSILEITQFLKASRKANIKFGSELIAILEKKIGEFIPAFNVKGDDPEDFPYIEETSEDFEAFADWKDWAWDNENKIFPEVDFQLPEIRWIKKFGETKEGDDWFSYEGVLNSRLAGHLNKNQLIHDASQEPEYWVENKNVLSPQVFLLTPLFHAMESVGYRADGTFVDHPFIRRILFSSFKDNLVARTIVLDKVDIDASSVPFQEPDFNDFVNGLVVYFKKISIPNPGVGEWKVHYDVDMSNAPDGSAYEMFIRTSVGDQYDGFSTAGSNATAEEKRHQGDIRFTVGPTPANMIINLYFLCTTQYFPSDYTLYLQEDVEEMTVFDFHPTIEFARFLPDWSFSTYLSNLKKFFNLKIDIDDTTKRVSINFNEKNYLVDGKIFNLKNQFLIEQRNNIEQESFLFRFDNDEDVQVFVDNSGVALNRKKEEYTKEIKNAFKHIPVDYFSAIFSESLEDKNGQGLMIYDPVGHKITKTFDGKKLSLEGSGGIIDSFWMVWIRFRLNAHNFKVTGPITNTELLIISKLQKIFTNGQLALVKKIDYKETDNGFLNATMELESVNL